MAEVSATAFRGRPLRLGGSGGAGGGSWGSSSSSREIMRDQGRLASGSALAWWFYWSLIFRCESWFEALE